MLDWPHSQLGQYVSAYFSIPSLSQGETMLAFCMRFGGQREERKKMKLFFFLTLKIKVIMKKLKKHLKQTKGLCGHSSGVRRPTIGIHQQHLMAPLNSECTSDKCLLTWVKSWLNVTQIGSNLSLKECRPAACLLHALSKTFQTDLKNVATWDMLTCSCGIPINQLHICDLTGNSSVEKVSLQRCIQSFWQH